jgi:hypothetical protein
LMFLPGAPSPQPRWLRPLRKHTGAQPASLLLGINPAALAPFASTCPYRPRPRPPTARIRSSC